MKEKQIKLDIHGKNYIVIIKEFNAYEAVVSVNGHEYRVGIQDLGIEQVADLQPQGTPKHAEKPVSPDATSGPVLHKPQSVMQANAVVAPLPGLVQKLFVKPGDPVQQGQKILVLEAMKMENEITSPITGTIKDIIHREGESVHQGDLLVTLE